MPCQGWDGGSIPLTCSIDESVRTFRTLIYRNQSKDWFFCSYKEIILKEGWCFMIKFITQEIPFEKSLKQRLEFICQFCKTKPIFINGNIRKIDKTNLSYIEPHRIIIKGITFLVFNYSTDIYIGNLANKIQISELENYLNTIK